MEVFVATYGTETEAGDGAEGFSVGGAGRAIHLIDGAGSSTADGKVEFEETADPSGKKWAKRGAIAGGVVGLIFPPSIIGTAIVGAAAGASGARSATRGSRTRTSRAIGDSIPPGAARSSPSPRTA